MYICGDKYELKNGVKHKKIFINPPRNCESKKRGRRFVININRVIDCVTRENNFQNGGFFGSVCQTLNKYLSTSANFFFKFFIINKFSFSLSFAFQVLLV